MVTNIGWDYMNLLGNTLPEIAYEKAGIIKPQVPVIIGETAAETKPPYLKRWPPKRQAPLFFADKQRYVAEWKYESIINYYCRLSPAGSDERTTYQLDLPSVIIKPRTA